MRRSERRKAARSHHLSYRRKSPIAWGWRNSRFIRDLIMMLPPFGKQVGLKDKDIRKVVL
jgi:hypothetical protein